ncbi:MAG: LysR family transcriptional regulator [Candidatus Rokubacteria bacterium]|nr:LysR family transcriptional regulator [Candidatus Rokubacteria bacterium]
MELRHLRYFVAVAQELHFGRAALRLRMAQPPLSQQILKLEAEVGVALFDRSKRRVELTKAGSVFFDEAKAILLHVERAAEAAQRSQRGQVDRLVVSFAPWVDLTILPRIIRTFGERHPDVDVQLRELNVPNQILAFRAGQIQVGFLYPPVHDRNLAVETILAEPLVVAFPEGHRLESFTRVPPDTLADEPQILLSREQAPAYHDLVVAFCRDVGFTLRVRHEAEHPQQVLSLVAAGMGIALVPSSAVTVERRELRHRPLDHAGPQFELAVAWRRSDASPVLHTFLDFVRNRARVTQRRRPARDGRWRVTGSAG